MEQVDAFHGVVFRFDRSIIFQILELAYQFLKRFIGFDALLAKFKIGACCYSCILGGFFIFGNLGKTNAECPIF